MSTVKWLLERNMFESYEQEFVDAAQALGYELKLTPEIGFGYGWDDSRRAIQGLFPSESNVIFHGSIGMAEELRKHSIWNNTTFCNWENLDCAKYYCHFSSVLLNADYAMLPFGELSRRRDWVFDSFGVDDTVFIRPNSCRKSFTGQVAKRATFDGDLEMMGFYDVCVDALVLISQPKLVTTEWRLVVVDRKVVTGCLYKAHSALAPSRALPDDVVDWFNSNVLSIDWEPDRAWTADVCQTDDSRLWLLEIGSVSCSDLYASNKGDFIEAVSQLVGSRVA